MARSTKYTTAASPQKTPVRVPLNDDRQEKAARRHAHQQAQRDSMRASTTTATPGRRRVSLAAAHDTPRTPSQDGDDMPDVTGTAVTPGTHIMPLLANFEEWMKMATDNKINANNSWNFALIDYFHEMSLLKEGDGVNFQKASCTLDGCVKIYTSRVDSVATDTGKLLSGLAENVGKKRRGHGDDADGSDEDEGDGEEAEAGEHGQKKRKKRAARSAEATLASSFAQLQNKKMELEFSVDPLFKKASADFDEGGAKGLLLNHLAIDGSGRIVFDSSDDANDAATQDSLPTHDHQLAPDAIDVDISGLTAKYFHDLSQLDRQDVCPSMKTFDLGDVNGSMDLPFLKAADNSSGEDGAKHGDDNAGNQSGLFLGDDNPMEFDDDHDLNMGGFDLPPETGFGEGGEIWAREAIQHPQARIHTMDLNGDENTDSADAQYGVSMMHGRDQEQENILSYFDQALKKSWAGPEHWRISRVKHSAKTAPATKRKEREPFEIDFTAPMTQTLADVLYTPATSNSAISLPKAQWKSRSRNLLPDDKHFNSKQLLRLFLKPKARMGSRKGGRRAHALHGDSARVDEAYWAHQGQEGDGDDAQGNYDADFFQDDGLQIPSGPLDDDDVFADARDHFSPPPDAPEATLPLDGMQPGSQTDAFGAQLVTQSRRFRPEYVQYARVAKKVDVKRLKDELWRGIGFDGISAPPQPNVADDPANKAVDGSLTFTDVVNSLQAVYPKQTLADISTSYCFICLLHLANEQGLVIENQETFENLTIRKDFTADLDVGGS
ncbi:uncharacterized protein J4E92_010595 [Alternaria infectoria]|uniref:uncharacterized protein n=1 Tax=Alternaria infectoria TaxID=45303 RepID=UPI00221EBAF2|nr:uncharacterized protein J4E92_010595 [Alternaria infectoria]KAI4909677.1 hypothetical protein J4E92_010595 [Alternaria infectoria]